MDKELSQSATAVREAVKEELRLYLKDQRTYLTSIATEMVPVCDALEEIGRASCRERVCELV